MPISFKGWSFTYPTALRLTYTPSSMSCPTPFSTTFVPSSGGLYAIMIYDANWRPLPYRLIYVGKAQNLAERVCRSHEKYESWERAAGGAQLYIAFHIIQNESARKAAERQIIEHYGPECNETFNHNLLALRALGLFSGKMAQLSNLR